MLNEYLLTLKSKTVVEFFAGIGLMRLGLERAKWKVVFANDISEQKYEMYACNFNDPKGHFLLEDIHKINADMLPSVTLATASFPCNDLSLAGMREGLSGKQSSAYWGFIKILEQLGNRRPPLVLLENVAGFLTSHEGRDLQSALLALNRLGYVVDPFIIDAVRFVPQSRVRLFVVGALQPGQGAWGIKGSANFYESDIRNKKLAAFIYHHPEIVWNIRQLPRLPQQKNELSGIIEDLPNDSAHWWGKPRAEYLINQMSEKHKKQLLIMKTKKTWSYGTVFRRVRKECSMAELRNDGIAGCLRTPRGGSGRQILVKAGYGQVMVRLLTPRECARLMGADDYVIDTTLNKALFGFGDAVCVPVIEWIAKNYLGPIIEELAAKAENKSYTSSSYRAEASDGN